MQSVTSNAVAKANSYSTTEHKTGRYCDNKPTYEKYFFKTKSEFPIATGITNVDRVVSVRAIAKSSNNNFSLPYYTLSGGTSYYGAIYFNSSNGNCYIETNLSISTVGFTVEYTKTTD